jgi:hypothetical protein
LWRLGGGLRGIELDGPDNESSGLENIVNTIRRQKGWCI